MDTEHDSDSTLIAGGIVVNHFQIGLPTALKNKNKIRLALC
jgi:hypothetical protein